MQQHPEQRAHQHRVPGRPFPPGTSGNPRGRAAITDRARADELERLAVAQQLTADLGRPASAAEELLIEQISMLIIRGRRLRARGQGADSEMVARLVVRGLAKLGVRPGPARPQLTGPAALAAWLDAAGAADASQPAAQTAAAPEGRATAIDQSRTSGPFPPPRGAVSTESP